MLLEERPGARVVTLKPSQLAAIEGGTAVVKVLEWVDNEIKKQERMLGDTETEMAAYRERNNAISLENKQNLVGQRLGSLNDNLPQFIVLGTPIADCCGGNNAHGAVAGATFDAKTGMLYLWCPMVDGNAINGCCLVAYKVNC